MGSFEAAKPCAGESQAGEAGAYSIQTSQSLPALLESIPPIAARLGGAAQDWLVREISDGNMNLVFAATGPLGSVVVKQALPFIRVIGASWPFPLARIHFEHEALSIHERLVSGRIPRVLHFDAERALLIMEHLDSYLVLRKGLIAGRVYPHVAKHLGAFLARSLFFTSDFFLSTPAKREMMARFDGNEVLCVTTEDVIFTSPYAGAPLNRWTSPELDATVASIRADGELKLAATELKLLMRSSAEALLHGDLHTGSVMVSDTDTRIIDPEWARFGPMGFDVGALMGNLLLAYFSQPGHATAGDDRRAYQEWLIATLKEVWTSFEEEVRRLAQEYDSELIPSALFSQPSMAEPLITSRLRRILSDAIGFAGAKMIRRVIGISHVDDFEVIKDPRTRACCEAKALALARVMMAKRMTFVNIDALAENIRSMSTREMIW